MYTCTSCGSRFETPHPLFKCASCGAVFDHKEATLLVLHVYEVREELVPATSKALVMEELKEVAERMGLSVRTSASLNGKSGLSHPVDMVVTDGKRAISFDIVVRAPPGGYGVPLGHREACGCRWSARGPDPQGCEG
uniref:Uncharacterized protein n=1 Tax=Thermofilum pendens TaxID=2269 RepID=A0A7C4F958_THEPE